MTGFNNYSPPAGQPLPSQELYAKSPEIPTNIAVSPKPRKPAKISEGVLLGIVSKKVVPLYPQIAKQLRISGEVKVEITIDEAGRVITAKAISGPQSLHSSAVDAAWKWVFQPTLLNKVPVSVRGELTFIFPRP